MCRGLSVVYKITTRRSTIDVRKKSDLSRKNRTTGLPGHVRKILDWPQPAKVFKIIFQKKEKKPAKERQVYTYDVPTPPGEKKGTVDCWVCSIQIPLFSHGTR